MLKKLKQLLLLIIISWPLATSAQEGDFGLKKAADKIPALPQGEPEIIVAGIIQAILGFVGIIFLLLIMYGGFQWMIGGREGEKKEIMKAKKIITGAAIGLIIIVTAYSITYYLTKYILDSTSQGSYQTENTGG